MEIEQEEKATLDAKIAAADAKLDKVTNFGRGWNVPLLSYPSFKSTVKQIKEKPTCRCETDKPIGTRDVDKFLREQQDKLWRDE